MEYDIGLLPKYIKSGNKEAVKSLVREFNLVVKDGKLVPSDKGEAENREVFWNQRQQARKILLDSI